MTLARRNLLIALGTAVFLLISFEVALALTAEGKERTVILRRLEQQARAQHRPGVVKIVGLQSGLAFGFDAKEGVTRVAWTTQRPDGDTVVQCARVRRTWSFTSGARVTLRHLSAPIGLEAGC